MITPVTRNSLHLYEYEEVTSHLGSVSFNFPQQITGLVQKGGGVVSPVQNQSESLFWAFLGRFLGIFRAFQGFFWPENLGKTHLSPESPKKGGESTILD